MAVNIHDPRPQARIRTVSGANATEPVGAYVDRSLTARNIDNGDVDEALPPRSGSTTQGDIRNFYANDMAKQIDVEIPSENASVEPPAHAPNSWAITDDDGISRGRDVYRNHGVLGQDDTLKNQGT